MTDEPPARVEGEVPVPLAWRPALEAVVAAFASGTFQPGGLPHVDPIPDATAQQVQEALAAYGRVTLVPLTAETWSTSVAMWWDDRTWQVLVDLRTREEGRSDLCLLADVDHEGDAFRVRVTSVHVP